jgi:cysteine desulfurase / selenocysteine lyase
MATVEAHEKALTGYALAKLAEIPGVTVIGPPDTVARGGAISFTVDGIHPHDVGQVLDDLGIAVRVGHHCAWPVIRRYGVPATTRATFYVHTGYDDIDALADGVRAAQKFFGVGPQDPAEVG